MEKIQQQKERKEIIKGLKNLSKRLLKLNKRIVSISITAVDKKNLASGINITRHSK